MDYSVRLIGINYQLYPIVFGLVYKIRFVSPLYVRALLRLPIFRVKQGVYRDWSRSASIPALTPAKHHRPCATSYVVEQEVVL